jgi:hypothetical protein
MRSIFAVSWRRLHAFTLKRHRNSKTPNGTPKYLQSNDTTSTFARAMAQKSAVPAFASCSSKTNLPQPKTSSKNSSKSINKQTKPADRRGCTRERDVGDLYCHQWHCQPVAKRWHRLPVHPIANSRAAWWQIVKQEMEGSFGRDLESQCSCCRGGKRTSFNLVHATIGRGRSDQGSSPCSKRQRSRGRTSAGHRNLRRPPPERGVGNSNQTPGRYACRST